MAPDSRAYQSASARISRPSASVLEISIVFPVERRDDVARPEGVAARAGSRRSGTTVRMPHREAELGDRAGRGEDGAAAAHVRLHLVHAVGRASARARPRRR